MLSNCTPSSDCLLYQQVQTGDCPMLQHSNSQVFDDFVHRRLPRKNFQLHYNHFAGRLSGDTYS